ncbi:MAG: 23S rRNA (guanosine(2251)-2'-O)-methyltransferase RlmB [Flavobacteriaceae bacterium]|nr:23S rRNA (guanosine(2251)-2'-O)-methyltransferase RlmB [Flavobacteriaceae bacterium]|tara:strand:+ start:7802 stop:8548 length:747 start_codon:yes stop_codon:yes gene_type:complete
MDKNLNIYGIHTILEAIKAGKHIEKVWLLKSNKGSLFQRLENSIRENNISHSYVPKERLERFKNKNHQGAVASLSQIKFIDIEEMVQKGIKESKSPTFLILDSITDPRNLGAIMRSAAATGVNGVIIPQTGSAPVNAAAIKTSSGGAFLVPISRVSHLKDVFFFMKSEKIKIVGVTEKSNDIAYDINLKGPVAFLFGSEEKGINLNLLKQCDCKIKLPMITSLDSLNVSVACGIVLYEKLRQNGNNSV